MDYEGAFKQNFVTNAFNGCEDILVLDRIFRQVGEDMIKFRKELLSKPPPKSLKDVVKNLIPSKSMARSVEGTARLYDRCQQNRKCCGRRCRVHN